jgi:hypothetical protein
MATNPDDKDPFFRVGRDTDRQGASRAGHDPAERPADPMKRALIAAPIVAVIVGLVVVLGNLPTGRPLPVVGTSPPSSPVAARDAGYLVGHDELTRRRDLAERGEEPYSAAAEDLLDWADDAVSDEARPTHPLVVKGTDNPFVRDARRAYGLGLAFAFTGEERYAQAARRTIRAWVDTAVATADTCPDSGGCHTSLILGRAGPGFAFGADLIADSDAWTQADTEDLQAWLHDVLLPAASTRPNNWGDAGTFLRVVAADYAGDEVEFSAAIDKWRSLIDLIEENGRIPEEVRRGVSGIQYTQEALQYKVAVAAIAERRGIDLWEHVGAKGGSLKAALDRLAYYWHRPEEWPDHDDPDVPSPGPVWELAYGHWQDPDWVEIMLEGRPYGDRGHSAIRWTTLTNGVPVDPLVAAGPSGSPDGATPGTSQEATPGPTAGPTRTPLAPAAVPPISGLAVRLAGALGNPAAVTVRWDAPALARATVEVERSIEGGDWAPIPIADSGNAASDAVASGAPRSYRVRAVVDGVAGLWAQVDGVTITRVEMTSETAALAGSWTRVAFGSYSRGAATSTDDNGARLVWRGTAAGLAIIGPVGATRGRMDVAWGGGVERIDLGRDDYTARTLLFSTNWPSPAERELSVEAVAVGGRRTVAVDDVVVLTYELNPRPGA